ncbi:MAG: MlaD family protein [Kofleriaceae bacterium]
MIAGGDERARLVVGTVVLAALGAAVIFVLAIWPRLSFGHGPVVEVAFRHVGALREGAPVIVAGRTVGTVASISLVAPGAVVPPHPLAGDGGALVRVRIAAGEGWRWAANAEVFISSKGVLGTRYLELGPPPDRADAARPIVAGTLVRGVDPPIIDRALQRTWDNLQLSRRFLDEVGPDAAALRAEVERLADTLAASEPAPGAFAELAARIRAVVAEARQLGATLAGAGADPAALAALADRAAAALARVRVAVDQLRVAAARTVDDLAAADARLGAAAPAATARIRAVLDDLDRQLGRAQAVAANVAGLLAVLARGEGSLARLGNDPEFPEDAKELGRILKRTPWRILGHQGQADTHPDP